MKRKQGMPEALSEEHFANLKRKAGLPVEPPVEKASLSNKKRKTTKGAAVAKKPEPAPKKASAKKSNGKAKKLPEPEEDSDEEMDDEFDLDQLEGDASSDEEASSGEKKKNIWSDDEDEDDDAEEDDSVFDSDDQEDGGKKGKFVFSDDEDESDAEEKLTAANIVGLSRKLDEKLAKDKAITETELQESAMQTNIDGPKIFGEGYEDDDEEDDLAKKSQSLLAPDLQLLRQRITDTIRVLDDFANLAEEGRSRAEYTAQLLKDICGVSLIPLHVVFVRIGILMWYGSFSITATALTSPRSSSTCSPLERPLPSSKPTRWPVPSLSEQIPSEHTEEISPRRSSTVALPSSLSASGARSACRFLRRTCPWVLRPSISLVTILSRQLPLSCLSWHFHRSRKFLFVSSSKQLLYGG